MMNLLCLIDGIVWKERETVTKFPAAANVKVDISGPKGLATNFKKFYSPMTVTALHDNRVNIYQWLNKEWRAISIEGLNTLNVTKVLLRDYGNLFGILLSNNTFVTHRRNTSWEPWEKENSFTNQTMQYDFVTMSTNGVLALGNKNYLQVHQEGHMYDKSYKNGI